MFAENGSAWLAAVLRRESSAGIDLHNCRRIGPPRLVMIIMTAMMISMTMMIILMTTIMMILIFTTAG